ncbi:MULTISPECIES: diacylglycerol/lipid kinase family protein [Bacillus]|uniref:diacylglycerol/lipid kinase family protein n=1 Tax=Bacillus TaxID=1386 RepID=UPI0012FEE7CB|nr:MULTISPECIES: diacylglycerol kinase family protein [Bacillus]
MYQFIVNPVAGNGKGKVVWEKTKKILHNKNKEYKVSFTKQENNMEDIFSTFEKDNEIKTIIIIGGDGTLHLAINHGLLEIGIPIGVIPAGSGNDFARTMKIPTKYEEALERIFKNKATSIDILSIGDRSCMNAVGIGFDAEVAEKTNRSKMKRLLNIVKLGHLSYILVALRMFFSYTPSHVTVTLDNKRKVIENVWLVAVANSPYYGGGLKICPAAKNDDGKLNICLVSGKSRLELIPLFYKVFKGAHSNHPNVTMLKGKKVQIECGKPLNMQGDGESLGTTPTEITIIPRALNIL